MRLLLLVLGASVCIPAAARACSALSDCPVSIPPPGSSVPANVPALLIPTCSPEARGLGVCTIEGDRPMLLAPDGREIAVEVEEIPGWYDGYGWGSWSARRLRPQEPLVPAAGYVLRSPWNLGCSEPGPVETMVEVTTAADLPADTGRVDIVETGRGVLPTWTTSGSCTSDEDVAFARLRVLRSEGLERFRAVSRLWASVDGEPEWEVAGDEVEFRALCGSPDDENAEGNIEEGTHTISVRGEILGSDAPIAPATARFDVVCRGCACDSGGGVSALCLLVPWLLRRRRLTPARATPAPVC